jgi:hypothetical protein
MTTDPLFPHGIPPTKPYSKQNQASQAGIGLLKSSESARRSPIDAAMNRIMQVSRRTLKMKADIEVDPDL